MRRHGDSPQETGTEKAPLGTGLSLQGGDFRLKQLQSYDLPAKSAVTFRQRKQQNDRRATLSETASAPWRSARWPRPILFLRATEPSQPRRVGTMSLKEWNVRPSSTDWRVWEAMVRRTNCGSGHNGSRLECSDECSPKGKGAGAAVLSAARRHQGQRRLPTAN